MSFYWGKTKLASYTCFTNLTWHPQPNHSTTNHLNQQTLISFAAGVVAAFSSLGLNGVSGGWRWKQIEMSLRSALNQLHSCVAWVGRKVSGEDEDTFKILNPVSTWNITSKYFQPDTSHYNSFNLGNFFSPLPPRGVEFSGPIWSPARLFINLANWSFIVAVPSLYGAIYKFRKAHAVTTIGRFN